jgi:erythromycin esterase-like protein
MKGSIWAGTVAVLAGGCTTSSPPTSPPVSPPGEPRTSMSVEASPRTLDEIVAQHAVHFDPGTLPNSLVELMAKQRVVVLGEHHGYREHHDLLLEVAKALHGRGARWVLFEGFQAESWAADAYTTLSEGAHCPIRRAAPSAG